MELNPELGGNESRTSCGKRESRCLGSSWEVVGGCLVEFWSLDMLKLGCLILKSWLVFGGVLGFFKVMGCVPLAFLKRFGVEELKTAREVMLRFLMRFGYAWDSMCWFTKHGVVGIELRSLNWLVVLGC
ncbi:hypothetical protein Droror1_Dr00000007 [Drosera rotundifolia]